MSIVITYALMLIIALGVLLKASDWFVDGAERIGLSFGVSPFVIGVTIVAFGTSLPELATSVAAVLSDNSSIVIGNVVGSNVTNILVVLGITSIIGGNIKLGHNIMDTDMPLLFISSILLLYVIQDLYISPVEIGLFLAAMIMFLLGSLNGPKTDKDERVKLTPIDILKVIGGGLLVWLGAEYTIEAIVVLSGEMGVHPDFIALTAVAIGTSLPEIVVSVSAMRRGQAAIAVGNVLGSNVFNTYFVIAVPALFGRLEVPASFQEVFVPIMVGVTLVFALICHSGRISRWEGGALLVMYAFFLSEVARLGTA